MKLKDKVTVVTGGANGLGRALCRRFTAEGARAVVVADIDAEGAKKVAQEINGLAVPTNVAIEADIVQLVQKTIEQYGPIDLFCSNAGVLALGGVEAPNETWQRLWDINMMAHLYAARALLPGMLARGEGYLLNVVSSAALLSQLGSAHYAVSKYAALALAEWISITHGDAGIKVSCVCPQGIRTGMAQLAKEDGTLDFFGQGALEPEAVADSVIAGLADERFLILPHPDVAEYFRRKASDYDRWLRGMRRVQARYMSLKGK